MTLKKIKLANLIKNVERKFSVQINQADLEAKILSNINLLKNIEPLILDPKRFNISKVKKFFSDQSVKYLKNFIF